jgi:hypothetical protein
MLGQLLNDLIRIDIIDRGNADLGVKSSALSFC